MSGTLGVPDDVVQARKRDEELNAALAAVCRRLADEQLRAIGVDTLDPAEPGGLVGEAYGLPDN